MLAGWLVLGVAWPVSSRWCLRSRVGCKQQQQQQQPCGLLVLAGWCWAGLQGVVHSLLPCAVMQQLGADLAAEIEAALFEAVDE